MRGTTQKINRSETSSQRVYSVLRSRILTKKWHPGDRLIEENIASELCVSRTPVREAIQRLANEGLVRLVPNAGARLASPSHEEIRNTFEVREYLECLAIARAAERITPEELDMLQETIDREEEIFSLKDFEAYLEANNHFHRIIGEASGNPVLAEFIDNLLARTTVYMMFYESFFDKETNPSLDEHRALLKALKTHDAKRAEQLMKVHLMLSSDSVGGEI